MTAFRVPRDPVEAHARCIATLETLHTFAVEVVEDIKASRLIGDTLTRKQTSEFNRACQMARFASDCLIASRWNVGGRTKQKRRRLLALGLQADVWKASPR